MAESKLDIYASRTYKLRMAPDLSQHAIYFTIFGGAIPRGFLINSKNMDYFHLIVPMVTAWSRELVKGKIPVADVIADMKETFDPRGSYTVPGKNITVNSLVHHLGLLLEEHVETVTKEMIMFETNYQSVRRWMDTVGQDTPKVPTVPSSPIVELRNELIREEVEETRQEFGRLLDIIEGQHDGNFLKDTDKFLSKLKLSNLGKEGPIPPKVLINLVKELADILVVVYGTFVAIGVDGDLAMNIVMGNNFGKVEKGTFRGDGKLIVPPEVKKQLKKEVTERLQELLSHGAK